MEEYLHFYYIVYSTLLFAQIRRLDFCALVLRVVRIAQYVGFCQMFCWRLCFVLSSLFLPLCVFDLQLLISLVAFIIYECKWYALSF